MSGPTTNPTDPASRPLPRTRHHATTRLAQWGLTPRTGPYSQVLIPGSLSHDETGFLWVTWPDRSISAFDGELHVDGLDRLRLRPQGEPGSNPWPPRESMPWPVVLLRSNLTKDDCDRLVAKIKARESLEVEVDRSTRDASERLAELEALGIRVEPATLCSSAEIHALTRTGPVLSHDRDGDLCYSWADGDMARHQWLEVQSTSHGRDQSPRWVSGSSSRDAPRYVIASELTASQDAAVWAATGRRARIEATRETITSTAERFAAAVCELARDNHAATHRDVLAWVGEAKACSGNSWLRKCTTRSIVWGVLQLKRGSCTDPAVNMRILQRLTIHAREILDILRADEWTPRARDIASMWVGDASPWTTGSLLDFRGGVHTRSFALFRKPPASLPFAPRDDHGSTNLWWTSDSIAAMLRDPKSVDGEALPRFVGERSWRSSVPTVIGRVNVPEQVAGDPDAVARVRRLWRMRVTTECRSKKIAAHIPPCMPEVIEVFS
mgnify:CR=1 FL=1